MAVASITIRNLDDDVKTRLRVRAADNDRSMEMEEEARLILHDAVGRGPDRRDLASVVRAHFGPDNGVDLELPPRGPGRPPPSLD